jgi:hypothetical protein
MARPGKEDKIILNLTTATGQNWHLDELNDCISTFVSPSRPPYALVPYRDMITSRVLQLRESLSYEPQAPTKPQGRQLSVAYADALGSAIWNLK